VFLDAFGAVGSLAALHQRREGEEPWPDRGPTTWMTHSRSVLFKGLRPDWTLNRRDGDHGHDAEHDALRGRGGGSRPRGRDSVDGDVVVDVDGGRRGGSGGNGEEERSLHWCGGARARPGKDRAFSLPVLVSKGADGRSERGTGCHDNASGAGYLTANVLASE